MLRQAISFILIASISVGYAQVPAEKANVKLKVITDQLTHPTALAVNKKSPDALFICEQEGRIRIIKKGKLLPTPFLDISKEVIKKEGYDERGLLGLTFHPDYINNGKFYVYCSIPVADQVRDVLDHRAEIREYVVSKNNPLQANMASMRKVLVVDEPQSNHNGGDVKFGADGYLYISFGDGGGQNDKHGTIGNAQNTSNLLGKILRIDVNKVPYGIPASNPFIKTKSGRPEIYAYGFRNPWRINFDRKTNRLFAGDVGQDKFEEVNLVTKGGNYGWRVYEGNHLYTEGDPRPANTILPITEYPHPEGISITGGYVYRGKAIPKLAGKYVFGDFLGSIWDLSEVKNASWIRSKLAISKDPGFWHVYSFGEDLAGELYILTVSLKDAKGIVYKMIP